MKQPHNVISFSFFSVVTFASTLSLFIFFLKESKVVRRKRKKGKYHGQTIHEGERIAQT